MSASTVTSRRAAEALLATAVAIHESLMPTPERRERLIAEAQLYATLAVEEAVRDLIAATTSTVDRAAGPRRLCEEAGR